MFKDIFSDTVWQSVVKVIVTVLELLHLAELLLGTTKLLVIF